MAEETTFGGKAIAKAWKDGGVECLFGIHGGMNVAVEEANNMGIRMYHFRHEQSAGFAADAYARALRRPGVCFASTAAGFSNYCSPIAQANGAASPVVLMIGQHGVASDKMGIFQEGYGTEVFKTFTRYTHRCIDWNTNSFWVRKALQDCMHYPPAPIVLEFPINNLYSKGPDRQQRYIPEDQVVAIPQGGGDPVEVEKVVKLLINAKRPLFVTGDGVYWSHGEKELLELAELLQVPVHSRRTGRGAVPEDHPLAVTGGSRGPLLKDADVIVIVGLKATSMEEWFEPPDWSRKAKYVQIQGIASDFWYGLPTEVGVLGSSRLVFRQMIDCARSLLKSPPDRKEWLDVLKRSKEFIAARRKEMMKLHSERKGFVHPHILGAAIASVLDQNATVIYDSFTATAYLTDQLEAKYAGEILDGGIHQTLGQGVGMAVGAQLARPGRQVLALMGDGGFGMSCMDMETLLRYKLPAVVVLFNNSSWGGRSVGHDQFYPKMDSWDNLHGLRYDKMFAELGCHAEYVENPEDCVPALERAFNSGKPSLVHVVGDATELHPLRLRATLVDIWIKDGLSEVPAEGIAELKKVSPKDLLRTQKTWRDWGVYISLEELSQIAGIPMPKET